MAGLKNAMCQGFFLKIGMKLVIPPKPEAAPSKPETKPENKPETKPEVKPTTPTAPSTPSPAVGAGESLHTVAAGDTLISLARKYYGKDGLWELIFDANKKTIGDDPADLKVGMKLVIPKKPS